MSGDQQWGNWSNFVPNSCTIITETRDVTIRHYNNGTAAELLACKSTRWRRTEIADGKGLSDTDTHRVTEGAVLDGLNYTLTNFSIRDK